MNLALNPAVVRLEVFAHRFGRSHARKGAGAAAGKRHSLDKGATLTLHRPLGTAIECLRGTLWVTHDGQPMDIVLESGQRYRSECRDRMLIHALSPSEVQVTAEMF